MSICVIGFIGFNTQTNPFLFGLCDDTFVYYLHCMDLIHYQRMNIAIII